MMPYLAAYRTTKRNGDSDRPKEDDLMDTFSSCREIGNVLVENGTMLFGGTDEAEGGYAFNKFNKMK
jgi:hypothetical protein